MDHGHATLWKRRRCALTRQQENFQEAVSAWTDAVVLWMLQLRVKGSSLARMQTQTWVNSATCTQFESTAQRAFKTHCAFCTERGGEVPYSARHYLALHEFCA